MIIKALLFIIVCIFVMETFHNLYRQREEYFTPSPELLDIDNTINANCTLKKLNAGKMSLMTYAPPPDTELDTPYSARFASMEYNKDRKYYANPHYLNEEGARRYNDENTSIANIQALYAKETDKAKKEELSNELAIYNWHSYIFKNTDLQGNQRGMQDITTDYYPGEIGMSRPWRERHSHLPDYSRILSGDTTYISDVKKYEKINPFALWIKV
uniref:Uncharacterized protein n=1 Tax=viral metagenome TaxID=1070528 RepID=A0A6C0HKZ7_9ZZZZ